MQMQMKIWMVAEIWKYAKVFPLVDTWGPFYKHSLT